MRKSLLDVALAILALFFVVVLVGIYVGSERAFYWWDFQAYHDMAKYMARTFAESPLLFFGLLRESIRRDYNFIFTVPLVPTLVLFHYSRFGYVLGVALFYLVPLALVMGATVRRLLGWQSRAAFWVAVFVTLLLSVSWAAIFRGYPDIGGALLIACIIYVYLTGGTLTPYQSAKIGFLIALLMLFRRHFTYSALAIIMSIALDQLLPLLPALRERGWAGLRALVAPCLALLLIPLTLVATLALIGMPFLVRLLTKDYTALYLSYMVPPAQIAGYLYRLIGGAAVLLALWGLAVGLRGLPQRRNRMFIVGVGALQALLWVFLSRQEAVHYGVQFVPLLVVGIAELCLWLWGQPRLRGLAALPAACLVASLPIGLGALALPSAAQVLAPLPTPPIYRTDYDEVRRMVDYLRDITRPDDAIYVDGSSDFFNYDTLRQAEIIFYGEQQARLNLPETPQIDSRDVYPLQLLLTSDYVVISTPFQSHINPAEQDVVRFPMDAFAQRAPIAQDFELLPTSFQLQNGAQIAIYRRTAPTAQATAIRTLDAIRAALGGERPGSQPDWVMLDPIDSATSVRVADGLLSLTRAGATSAAPATLLLSSAGGSVLKVAGALGADEGACALVQPRLRLLDADQRVLRALDLPAARAGEVFAWSADVSGAHTVLLELVPEGAVPCMLDVRGLRARP
ncbi:hypothetical protein F8S13_17005 [Chloroflexia bacterium SDU3-3]|nr:hypothetical protein F8S13_17005 [Chloroflexia bacterium SDU3-3]